MAGESSKYIAYCRARLVGLFSSQAFQYEPIELDEGSAGADQTSENILRPKNMYTENVVTGDESIGGTELGTTNVPPMALMKRKQVRTNSAGLSSMEGDEPTEEERRSLRRVSDTIPWSAFLVAVIELCERFTYYGLSGPFQNYIQNPYDDPRLPGAIGMP